jgi:Uma2 family endonuclease
MLARAHYRITPEEYLRGERDSEIKHAYVDGEVYAMAGASFAHVQITNYVARALGNRLQERPCDVLTNHLRVKVDDDMYVYPDVVVVCGEPRVEVVERQETLTNPLVIIEVLSPSTETYDRGRKFARYRGIETLSDYVLIAQDRPGVEHYARLEGSGGARWLFRDAAAEGGILRLDSLGCELMLDDIYRRVTFPPDASGDAPG